MSDVVGDDALPQCRKARSAECRGCGAPLGTVHRKGCPYAHPWPRERVDNVQTRIDPVPTGSAAPREQERTDG